MAGCTHVLHMASPVLLGGAESVDEYIKPAVQGTKAVMEVCLKHQVKRVVYTSSNLCVCLMP